MDQLQDHESIILHLIIYTYIRTNTLCDTFHVTERMRMEWRVFFLAAKSRLPGFVASHKVANKSHRIASKHESRREAT
jgi:hypothetical protein